MRSHVLPSPCSSSQVRTSYYTRCSDVLLPRSLTTPREHPTHALRSQLVTSLSLRSRSRSNCLKWLQSERLEALSGRYRVGWRSFLSIRSSVSKCLTSHPYNVMTSLLWSAIAQWRGRRSGQPRCLVGEACELTALEGSRSDSEAFVLVVLRVTCAVVAAREL